MNTTSLLEHDFDFVNLILTTVFLALVFFSSKLFEMLRVPSLVGEIIIGALVGPLFADLVPSYEMFMLLGELGLVLLVVQAGLEIQLSIFKQIGFRSFCGGLFGSVAPVLIGMAIGFGFGFNAVESFSIGACFCATSVGIAIVILKAGKILNTPLGQLIVATAAIDDVVALVILSELQAIAGPNSDEWDFIIPVISAIGFVSVFGTFAVFITPSLVLKIEEKFKGIETEKVQKIFLCLLSLLSIGLMTALHYGRSSYLLGAFLGGLSFCSATSVKLAWHTHVKTIMKWLLRLFFAATVGFQIPLKSLWTTKIIGMGFALFSCMLGKLLMGLFAVPLNTLNFFVGGLAASVWAEFSLVMASTALHTGIIDEDTYSSIVFAILLSIIISPVILQRILEWSLRKEKGKLKDIIDDELEHPNHVYYKFYLRASNVWGLQMAILKTLHALNLEIIDFHIEIVEGVVAYESYLKDMEFQREIISDPKIERRILGVLNEMDTQLVLKQQHTRETTATTDSLNGVYALSRWYVGSSIATDDDRHRIELGTPVHVINLTRWLPAFADEEELLEFGRDEIKVHRAMNEEGWQHGFSHSLFLDTSIHLDRDTSEVIAPLSASTKASTRNATPSNVINVNAEGMPAPRVTTTVSGNGGLSMPTTLMTMGGAIDTEKDDTKEGNEVSEADVDNNAIINITRMRSLGSFFLRRSGATAPTPSLTTSAKRSYAENADEKDSSNRRRSVSK